LFQTLSLLLADNTVTSIALLPRNYLPFSERTSRGVTRNNTRQFLIFMNTKLDDYPILIAQEGPLKGQRWTLDHTLVLGRDSACDLTIPDRKVSRFHARLTTTSDGVLLEDMGSKNGTFCNGDALTAPLLLQDGDLVQIAVTQTFMFLISDATMPLTENNTRIGRLMMDLRSRRVLVDQQQITPPLSAQQFRLLWRLYEQQGDVVPRSDLVAAVWGEEEALGVSDQALDALIRRLRDKLAGYDPSHQYIVTVRGHGIRLDNPLE
jgi:DNA-binding winged helix-turn-helix (wHTH) protein